MMPANFIIALTFLVISATAAPTDPICPGGYKEGDKAEKGTAWFECRNGQLVAKGCVSQNGDRLKLQDTYDQGRVRLQCQLDSSGNPSLIGKSCVQDNREYQVEERWDDTKYVYTCKKDGNDLKMIATGCIRNGQRLDIGQRMTFSEAVYECKKDPSAEVPIMSLWGCAAKDGSQYASGQAFDEGQYWYTCENTNGVISVHLSGCVNEKVRIMNGDRFSKGDVVYECQAVEDGGNLKVIGCLQEDVKSGRKIERRVGCTWTEGDLPYQVTMTCIPDQATKTATATPIHCDYKMPGDTTYSISIGCYRIFENVAVGCSMNPSTGKVTSAQIPLNEKGNDVQSVPEGLKFC